MNHSTYQISRGRHDGWLYLFPSFSRAVYQPHLRDLASKVIRISSVGECQRCIFKVYLCVKNIWTATGDL